MKASICCNARVQVETNSGTTMWYVCESCKQPCDVLEACEWKFDEFHCKFDTECKEANCFEAGGPIENNYQFCPFCGKQLYFEHILGTNYENALPRT